MNSGKIVGEDFNLALDSRIEADNFKPE